jgi:two-component system CheB/CheR fusion protein
VLGVLVLFGRPSPDDLEDEDFLREVAGAVGDGIVRYRAHRRLELELEAMTVVNRAPTLAEAGRGLLRALRGFRVEELQIGEIRRAAPECWVPLFTSVTGARATSAFAGTLPPAGTDGLTFSLLSDGRGEAWLPIGDNDARRCLVQLRGKELRAPDPEFARGLERVGNLLRAFLARHSIENTEPLEPSRREEQQELQALYSSLPVAVSLYDQAGALLRINRELAPIETDGPPARQASEAEQRERTVLRRLYTEELPRWVERALATGETLRDVELRVTEGDERRFWLCNFVPLRDGEGGVQRVSVVAQDITALKRVEALRDADRRKDDFIALLGHELRNPIAAMRNATELLARSEQPTPQLRRLQGIYERQTLHTAKLLDGLLDVARVARGKIRLQRTPLPVVELVRAAVDDRRAQFQARRLELRLPDGELWVSADRVRLLQIVDNLLSNALKFTSEAGRIGVDVVHAAELGEIVIADDGAGIEPEVLNNIFEPFWQARSSAEATGLGLGLALVRGLAQLHGFRITAESKGSGRGASFRLIFPLVDAPEAATPPSQVAHRALDLMLVEDNGDVSETLAELLDADGHRVEVASSAERALERLGVRRVDVVLIDIGLPGMNGLELAARLRQDPDLSSMGLVALTGFGDAATEGRMLQAGFDRYLLKPVRFEALRHCLARVRVTSAGSDRERTT